MRPTERFSDRVADYARYRPSYPGGMVDVLAGEISLEAGWVVADVGSGTGLSSEPFLAWGCTVVAVEPNAAMRAAAEARLGGRPGFRSVAGTAEATTLSAASVDLVVCAQAFHWFDVDRARGEFRRILRPGGRVALIWNRRRQEGTPFLREYEALLGRHGRDYEQVRHDRLGTAELGAFLGESVTRCVVPNEQRLDLEGLKGRLRSSSYLPATGPAAAAMLSDAERLFRAHQEAGEVRLIYDTEIYLR